MNKTIIIIVSALINLCCTAQNDTLNFNHTYGTSSWNKINYIATPYSAFDGYVMGTNIFSQKENAQIFTLSNSFNNKIEKVFIHFGVADTTPGNTTQNKFIRVKVYTQNAVTLNPDNLLGSEKISFKKIITDVGLSVPTEVVFTNPIAIPNGNSNFFISVAVSGDSVSGGNLDWNTHYDSLSVYSNITGESTQSEIWKKHPNDIWCNIETACDTGTTGLINMKCSMWIFPIMATNPLAIPLSDEEKNISIFPNPASNQLYVNRSYKSNEKLIIRIDNIVGQIMHTSIIDENQEQIRIDTSDLPKGCYFLKAINKNGESIPTKRIIIQ